MKYLLHLLLVATIAFHSSCMKCMQDNLPLHTAVKKADIKEVVTILATGTNIDATDDNGKTALDLSEEITNEDVKERISDAIIGAMSPKQILGYLKKTHPTMDTYDKLGRTAMHTVVAVLNSSPEKEELLDLVLKEGANINLKDIPAGFTALHWAAAFKNKPLFDLLLAKGASDTIKDNIDRTPSQLVEQLKTLDTIKELEKRQRRQIRIAKQTQKRRQK